MIRASTRSLRSQDCRTVGRLKKQPEGHPSSRTTVNAWKVPAADHSNKQDAGMLEPTRSPKHRRPWSDRNKLTLQASEDLACRRSGRLGDLQSRL